MSAAARSRLMLVSSMLIFGTIGLFRRSIPLPSSLIAQVRGLVGTLFLVGVMLVGRRRFNAKAIRANLPVLLASGALIGVNWILLFEAYNHTTVPVATLCYYMAPIFVMLASPIVLHERLTRRKLACTGAALLGMVLVSGVVTSGVSGMSGILLGLGAAACYACVMLLNKKLHDVPTFDRTVLQLAVTAVLLLPYVLATENVPALSFTWQSVALLLLVGVVHTGFAYYLYFGAMGALPAQTTAICSYIDPVASILLAWAFLGEAMDVFGWIGSVLILGAAILCELPEKKRA